MTRKKMKPICFVAVGAVVCFILIKTVYDMSQKSTKEVNQYAVYASTIQQSNCYLCGDDPNSPIAPYLGEDNIGLINLNSFDVFRFEVNRYSEGRELIEKLVKYPVQTGWHGDKETGSKFNFSVNCNQGYTDATVRFNESSDLQLDEIQTRLCSECLTAVMDQYWSGRHWDVALIDFKSGVIKPFNKHETNDQLSDYYVSMQYNDEYDSIHLLAFYAPARYDKYDHDPNLSTIDEIVQYCADNDFAFTMNAEVKDFLSDYDKIGGISRGEDTIKFMDETSGFGKELTIYKDGTYEFFDFDSWTEDSKSGIDNKSQQSK